MPTKKNSFHFLIYLTLLSIVGFLCTDMYLPAFDVMHIDLGTSKSNISYTLTFFLAGFALAQLFWGPIADKKGNKVAILYGLLIFIITSLFIFYTDNIIILLILRLFQAFGVCSATVCWQSLVIERYPKSKTNKIFSSIMPLVALSPALSPLLGVFIQKQFGWRYIFILLFSVGVLLILYTLFIKNNISSGETGANISPKKGINYFSFFTSKKYVGNILIYGFCSAAFFAWLTGAPFFLKTLGYDETAIGLSFIPQTIAFLVGGYGLRIALSKVDGKRLIPYIILIYSLSLIWILYLAIFTVPTLTALLIPFSIMALTNGACYPIVVNEALKEFPKNSGKAAALQNTVQLGICFIASGLVSIFSDSALLATVIVMALTIPFVVVGYRLSVKTT